MRYPADAHYFPTKNEMGDFLEHYARTFDLPVINDARVHSLTKENSTFVVQSSQGIFESDNVVVAMANYQQPKIPAFANTLDSNIVQFHSCFYRNPDQLQSGDVLLVGAGNSGSELAMELSKTHKVYMSGRDTGHIPFRIATKRAQLFFIPLVLRLLFHRIFTINTMIGRKLRSKVLTIGGPLIRVKPVDLQRAGVVRVAKTKGTIDGKPILEDGRVLDVKNVIWCTGFHTGFSWIKLPVLGKHEPLHRGGIVPSMPGLYFTGLHFLYSMSSGMVQGVRRDAARIVNHLKVRMKTSKAA
jgi:putative flavoprotein involved in K+ transport